MQLDHCHIKATLLEILTRAGIKFTEYSDSREHTSYHLVDGKSIKFWNIFPNSGSKVDAAVMTANDFLRPYGLYLAYHILTETVNRLLNAVVPQQRGSDVRCKAYVDVRHSTISLLVKPLPTAIDF